jgi:hypothetical protein
MGSITYKASPGENSVVTWRGIKFEDGKAIEVTDATMLRKAKNNPFFEVKASKEEEERGAKFDRDPNAGAVTQIAGFSHPQYYETGGGASAVGEKSADSLVPSEETRVGPGVGTNAGTILGTREAMGLGDELAPGLQEMYGTKTPEDSQEPAEPVQVQPVKKEVQQAQQEAAKRGRPSSK